MYEKITAYLDFFGRDAIPESELQEKTKEFGKDKGIFRGFHAVGIYGIQCHGSNGRTCVGQQIPAERRRACDDGGGGLRLYFRIYSAGEFYSGRFGGFGPAGCAAGHSEAAEGARRIAVSVWNDRRNCGGRRTRMRAGPATALRGLPGFCRPVTA